MAPLEGGHAGPALEADIAALRRSAGSSSTPPPGLPDRPAGQQPPCTSQRSPRGYSSSPPGDPRLGPAAAARAPSCAIRLDRRACSARWVSGQALRHVVVDRWLVSGLAGAWVRAWPAARGSGSAPAWVGAWASGFGSGLAPVLRLWFGFRVSWLGLGRGSSAPATILGLAWGLAVQ